VGSVVAKCVCVGSVVAGCICVGSVVAGCICVGSVVAGCDNLFPWEGHILESEINEFDTFNSLLLNLCDLTLVKTIWKSHC
jgi:hypothetical protein